jgi:hypothetical protein
VTTQNREFVAHSLAVHLNPDRTCRAADESRHEPSGDHANRKQSLGLTGHRAKPLTGIGDAWGKLMKLRGSFSKLARLSGLSTLAVSIGAVTSAASYVQPSPPQAIDDSAVARLKVENGQLYLADRSGSFTALELGSTPEAAELAALLSRLAPDGSPVTVPVGRLIVADGGMSASSARSEKAKRKTSSGK